MSSENEEAILLSLVEVKTRVSDLHAKVESMETKFDKRLRPIEKMVYGVLGILSALGMVAILYQAFIK